jgi:hypothetical protein
MALKFLITLAKFLGITPRGSNCAGESKVLSRLILKLILNGLEQTSIASVKLNL